MNLKCYRYCSNETHLDFEFYSDGPMGKIRKIVRYRPLNTGGISFFNLGFGDFNPKTGKIDDLAVTNNQDREKILATIGYEQNKGWEFFQKNVRYEAFLVKRK
jgi:hypothetical protein